MKIQKNAKKENNVTVLEEKKKTQQEHNTVKSLLHDQHKRIKFKLLCCQGQLGKAQLLRKATRTQSPRY